MTNKSPLLFFVCLMISAALMAQNVGISDQLFTPQSPLHIYKTTDGNMLQISFSTLANTGLQINMVGGINFNLINRQAGYLGFYTSNTERMRILSGGNVGIGTTAPTTQLHTTGTVRFQNYPSGVNGAIVRTDNTGTLQLTQFSGNAGEVLLGNNTFGPANTSATAWQLLGNTGTNPATNFLGTIDAQDLVFRTNNLQRMRISSTGFAGINTNPNAAYQLFVNGSAGTTGIYSSITVSAANQHAVSAYSTGAVAGTGYGVGASSNAVQGYTYWGYAYRFGVAGYRFDDGQGPSGGVFGAVSSANPPAAWGALGFQDASLGEWGGYFTGRGYFSDNVGIGIEPTQRLHVQGNFRLQGAFMPNNNAGSVGHILVSQGPGTPPQWQPPTDIIVYGNNAHSVTLTNIVTHTNNYVWQDIPGMSINFTPVHTSFYIFSSLTARLADNSGMAQRGQALIQVRVLVNGTEVAKSTSIITEYYEDGWGGWGLLTSGTVALSGVRANAVIGSPTTVRLQWRPYISWAVNPWRVEIDPNSAGTADHCVLTIFD